MKIMTAVVLIVLLALFITVGLTGCQTASAKQVYGKEDTNIEVKKGEAFIIELEENPTTGYAWTVSISDESVIRPGGDQYNDESSGEGLVGAPGTHSFTFEALAKGTATITLVYERSWEENSGIETIVYNVTVK
jgi:inhibitor of cysteine peptidase